MELVINKCYGGFGVSIAAMKEMIGKCPHVVAHDPIKWYGSKKSWQKALAEPRHIHRDYLYFDERGWPVTDQHDESRDWVQPLAGHILS